MVHSEAPGSIPGWCIFCPYARVTPPLPLRGDEVSRVAEFWLETQPTLVAVTVGSGSRARTVLESDLEWLCAPSYGHRTETTIIFGRYALCEQLAAKHAARPMRLGGRVHSSARCAVRPTLARPWPAREESSRLESLQAQSWAPHLRTAVDCAGQLAKSGSRWLPSRAASKLAALARSEHERLPGACRRAALPQRAFSENTTKRDIPTFVRARIREFEAARECVVIPTAHRPQRSRTTKRDILRARAPRWRHASAS